MQKLVLHEKNAVIRVVIDTNCSENFTVILGNNKNHI